MGKEPSAHFMTSLIERFVRVVGPHYKLLEFLNDRAQASESASSEPMNHTKRRPPSKSTSHERL